MLNFPSTGLNESSAEGGWPFVLQQDIICLPVPASLSCENIWPHWNTGSLTSCSRPNIKPAMLGSSSLSVFS